MKLSVTLKDPDGFGDSVDVAVREEIATLGLDQDEAESVFEIRREKVWTSIKKWVGCQEYITIDFDTDAGTATVREDRG